MSIEIQRTGVLSEQQWQRLFNWSEDIFGANDLNLKWRPKDLHFLLYEDGEPVSHVGVLKHTVAVGGNSVTVGGVGGVVTVAESQRKGYARQLMLQVRDFFENEWQVDAGLLFCLPRMISYYESLGWQKVEDKVLIEQPDEGTIESPMGIMVLPLGKKWESGTVELKSLPW